MTFPIKKQLLFTFLLLFSLLSMAQVNHEILDFVDSTALKVNKGRQYTIHAVEQYNTDNIKKGYEFLVELGDGNYVKNLSFYEYYALTILAKDYQLTLKAIKDYNSETFLYQKYPNDNLYNTLNQALIEREQELELKINQSALKDDERHVLLELLYIFNGSMGDDPERLNKNKDFAKLYPESDYIEFVDQNLPIPAPTGGLFYTLGATNIRPMGSKFPQFMNESGWGANMYCEFLISQFYFSFYFHGGSIKLDESVELFTDNHSDHFYPDDSFQWFSAGLGFGYDLVKNSKVMVAPTLSILGASMNSTLYDTDNNDLEYYIYESFTLGYSVNTAFKLFEFSTQSMYGDEIASYFGIKASIGVEQPVKYNMDNCGGVLLVGELGLIFGLGDL